jgi:hypothetical protein
LEAITEVVFTIYAPPQMSDSKTSFRYHDYTGAVSLDPVHRNSGYGNQIKDDKDYLCAE